MSLVLKLGSYNFLCSMLHSPSVVQMVAWKDDSIGNTCSLAFIAFGCLEWEKGFVTVIEY